jgi:hypothetical protein
MEIHVGDLVQPINGKKVMIVASIEGQCLNGMRVYTCIWRDCHRKDHLERFLGASLKLRKRARVAVS